jgi:16S rRNA (cytidine1402-2'-O)-methyltransferase
MPGILYLVATPIGNLQDITPRAVETLRSVDLIACEDTRHTLKLLNHCGIKNRLMSYHEHNENERQARLIGDLENGKSIAIVSDAGTPGICDPGYRIVEAARTAGIRVVPIPGAAAFVSALVASGLATDSLFFGGFLPSKKSERIKRLEEIRSIPATLVFYEAPHRLAKSLADCLEVLGSRHASVARELTKLHEEIVFGSIRELWERYSKESVKGEIVIVIDRPGPSDRVGQPETMSLPERVAELEADGMDPKSALKKAAKEFGLAKSEAYRLVQNAKDEG